MNVLWRIVREGLNSQTNPQTSKTEGTNPGGPGRLPPIPTRGFDPRPQHPTAPAERIYTKFKYIYGRNQAGLGKDTNLGFLHFMF